MAGRKVGVGFNHPLVLGGRMQFDWHQRNDFMRRLTRLKANRGRGPMHCSPSLIEALREYTLGELTRRPKREKK
jgi:hypothetical protein